MTKRYTERELYDFISRIDSKEKALIAERFIREYAAAVDMDFDLFDDLMMAISWLYMEQVRIERGY